jgi:hypothetical protein
MSHGSKGRIDGFEAGDVIGHVSLRGGVSGREPYHINAEVAHVVECGQDAGDVL